MAIATLLSSAVVRRLPAVVTCVAHGLVAVLVMAMFACNAGRELGESCDTSGECSSDLQCLRQVCVPRCHAHVDCGDGAVCGDDGECRAIQSQVDDPCFSELECGVGQTCRLTTVLGITPGTCQVERAGGLEGESCTADEECRIGGCALGRCVALCRATDDCRRGWACAAVPLPARSSSVVNACLPGNATIDFELKVPTLEPGMTMPELLVPVPSTARSMVMVFEAPSPSHIVGATLLVSPENKVVYRVAQLDEAFFTNAVRHAPRPGVSVLQVPSSSDAPLIAGIYKVTVSSTRDTTMQPSTEPPTLHIIEKLGSAARLDLHFYFLDLAEHPCAESVDVDLSAATAPTLSGFQFEYLDELRRIFAAANITLGEVTYQNLQDLPDVGSDVRPQFDILQATDAGALFALPTRRGGISVFFVRSMEPEGQQLLTGGTPGSPLPGTAASGIAIALDTMCYRSWREVARQTAHGLARHMGLFRNVEPDGLPGHVDRIDDSDEGLDNLMHWSEFGGTDLSLGQREILRASPVLR